ncbi:MAG: hypothetical protein ABSD46_02340 [Bacteroidota bacterium]
MPTFQFSTEQSEQIKRRFATKVFALIGSVVTVLMVTSYLQDPFPIIVFPFIIVPCAIAIAVAGFVKIMPMARAEASLQVTLEQDSISSKKVGTFQTVIHRSDVSRIVDISNRALRIESNNKFQWILVPKELMGYDQIRSALSVWAPIETEPDRRFIAYSVILILLLLSFIFLDMKTVPRIFGINFVSLIAVSLPIVLMILRRRQSGMK